MKHQITDRRLNASRARDTARLLPISPTTVLRELKRQEAGLASVHTALLRRLNPEKEAVDIAQAGEAERDERWSYGGNKGNPRWRWHAIDHRTGAVLAYGCGRRTDEASLQRKALLEPFALTRYDTDHGGADTRHLAPDVPSPGQRNTQHIERQHVTLRTRMQRLVRKTLCVSTSVRKHDLVLGWFVHRYACGRAGSTWLSPLLEHYPFRYIKGDPRHQAGPARVVGAGEADGQPPALG